MRQDDDDDETVDHHTYDMRQDDGDNDDNSDDGVNNEDITIYHSVGHNPFMRVIKSGDKTNNYLDLASNKIIRFTQLLLLLFPCSKTVIR